MENVKRYVWDNMIMDMNSLHELFMESEIIDFLDNHSEIPSDFELPYPECHVDGYPNDWEFVPRVINAGQDFQKMYDAVSIADDVPDKLIVVLERLVCGIAALEELVDGLATLEESGAL